MAGLSFKELKGLLTGESTLTKQNTPVTAESFYHFTTFAKLSLIIQSGYIKPLSEPYGFLDEVPPESPMQKEGLYVVGMPDIDAWERYQVLGCLFKYARAEVRMKLPVPKSGRVYFRDIYPLTPEGSTEILGRNVMTKTMRGDYIGGSGILDVLELKRIYQRTTVPLDSYQNDFRVPEIWVGGEISIDECLEIRISHLMRARNMITRKQ